jgi:hypothetical protein
MAEKFSNGADSPTTGDHEKHIHAAEGGQTFTPIAGENELHKSLKGRHMQMIAMYVRAQLTQRPFATSTNNATVVVQSVQVSSSVPAVLSRLVAQPPSSSVS